MKGFDFEERVIHALNEDVGFGDITTEILIGDEQGKARIVAEELGVLAGIREAKTLFEQMGLEVTLKMNDGDRVEKKGATVMIIEGSAKAILTCERTALNFLMRMSGIATAIHETIEKAKKINPGIRIAVTRKTAPLLRYFDKRAAEIGGGDTHRFRLDDCILIKDNHLTLVGDVETAITIARTKASFSKKVEIEVENTKDCLRAAKAKADIIMLDNMKPNQIRQTIIELRDQGLREKVIIEASGGITFENVDEYAATGVDVISMGSLTHSVKALSLSLELIKSHLSKDGP
ncbi:MAG: carboxylating nicotinate-nucleotide diphosphorylase [Candidatus Hodarchaeota archaeon]